MVGSIFNNAGVAVGEDGTVLQSAKELAAGEAAAVAQGTCHHARLTKVTIIAESWRPYSV